MSSIDIRNGQEEIDEIIIWDDDQTKNTVYSIDNTGTCIYINDSLGHNALEVECKAHALNIIKALQKAIELEWLV